MAKEQVMTTNDTNKDTKRRRKLFVNWKEVDGASVKKRVLHFDANDKGEYLCPIEHCLHIGFRSQRGIRKHINNIHPWYLYFNEQPNVNRRLAREHTEVRRKSCTKNFPAFTLENGIGKEFLKWLQTPCGGGRTSKESKNIARRAMKFLMSSYGENSLQTVLKEDYIDCCIGSPTIVMDFLKLITEEWGLQAGSALPYMKSIGDLLDFRKASGVTDDALRSFTVTEVYIRRGKENLAKKKKLEYGRNLDLETLISRNSWASLEEMEKVIPYHTPKYEYVWKKCKARDEQPSVSELSFATRFIVTFLFLRVKCTRPMTFQFLTLDMINSAKTNGGYVDQTSFKTQDKYVFDTLILTTEVLKILDSYINIIRPFLSPKCDYVLVTNNGTQYTAFGSAMSLLVFQAIGKSVNPTRYRQIIESESAVHLNDKEREVVSKDQRHSSQVARRIYQKRLSRDVASEARSCIQKLTGAEKEKHNQNLASTLSEDSSKPSCSKKSDSATICDEMPPSEEAVDYEATPTCSKNVDNVYERHLPNTTLMETAFSEPENEVCEVIDVVADNNDVTAARNAIDGRQSTDFKTEDEDEEEDNNSQKTMKNVIDLPEKEVKLENLENHMNDNTRLKRFTMEEDRCLRDGVTKYGYGLWKDILKDKEFTFHPSRTRDSLRMRAKTLKIKKKAAKKT